MSHISHLKQPQRKIKLRTANENDIGQILLLAREMFVDSRYAWMPAQPKIIRDNLLQVLSNPSWRCIVAVRDDDLIAFLIGSLELVPFGFNRVAVCRFLYATHRARGLLALKLLRSFKAWAKQSDAQELRVDDMFGTSFLRSKRLFEKLGLQQAGGIFSLWL